MESELHKLIREVCGGGVWNDQCRQIWQQVEKEKESETKTLREANAAFHLKIKDVEVEATRWKRSSEFEKSLRKGAPQAFKDLQQQYDEAIKRAEEAETTVEHRTDAWLETENKRSNATVDLHFANEDVKALSEAGEGLLSRLLRRKVPNHEDNSAIEAWLKAIRVLGVPKSEVEIKPITGSLSEDFYEFGKSVEKYKKRLASRIQEERNKLRRYLG